MLTLFEYVSGSHAYGLNNQDSDVDVRSIVIETNPSYIIGLKKFEHSTIQNEEKDVSSRELRSFFQLLRKSNTESIEALFVDRLIECEHPFFKTIRENRYRMLDSYGLYKCLRGYMQGEKSQIFGEVSNRLGAKRKTALEKYGYSYRNLIHFIRLSYVGQEFFAKGVYPVNLEGHSIHKLLKRIKSDPNDFSITDINDLMTRCENGLENAYNHSLINYRFDEEYVDDLCCSIYQAILDRRY